MMYRFVMPRTRLVCLCVVCGFLMWMVMPWLGRHTNLSQLREKNLFKAGWIEHLTNLCKPYNLSPEHSVSDKLPSGNHSGPWKTILFWNRWFGYEWSKSFGPTTPEGLREAGCPTWRCRFSYNRGIVTTADAVIFEAGSFTGPPKGVTRPLHQRTVWVAVESPISSSGQRQLHLVSHHNLSLSINWTMTYHSEADIGGYYGHFRSLGVSEMPMRPNLMAEHRKALERHQTALARGDTLQDVMGACWKNFVQRPRVVAFMTSHCITYSRREEYVVELQKYMKVDRYGGCVKRICGNRHIDDSCWGSVLSGNYSFYMAMENSFCSDYATEKLYLALVYKMVPVVWGGSDYDKLLPPLSYINARHYHPRNLARLLMRLHQDPVAYGRYHLWRGYLKPVLGGSFCELCHRLHTDTAPSHHQDVAGWAKRSGNCVPVPVNMFNSGKWREFINDTEVTPLARGRQQVIHK